jgi:hypothetical protein
MTHSRTGGAEFEESRLTRGSGEARRVPNPKPSPELTVVVAAATAYSPSLCCGCWPS